MPGFDVSSWIALSVQAKTPPTIVSKLHADSVAAVSDPMTKRKLEEMGVAVVGSTPAELAAQVKADIAKWGPVIKRAGISVRD